MLPAAGIGHGLQHLRQRDDIMVGMQLARGPVYALLGQSPLSSYPSSRVQRRIATGGLPHMSKFSPFQQPAAQPSRRANGLHRSAMSFGSYGVGFLHLVIFFWFAETSSFRAGRKQTVLLSQIIMI